MDLKGQQVFPDDSIRETVYLSPFQPCGLATFCVGNDRYGLLNAKGEVAMVSIGLFVACLVVCFAVEFLFFL